MYTIKGRYTSAYWHNVRCYDIYGDPIPNIAGVTSSGCAAPRNIPLCSQMLVCTSYGCDICTVVDRQRDDIVYGQPHIDLQWAVAHDVIPEGYDDHTTVFIRR